MKGSVNTNTPAPEGAPVFICRHVNLLFDVKLHGKLADLGNCTACKWKYWLPWKLMCSYSLLSSMPNDPQSRGPSFIRYYQVPVLNQSLANLVSRAKFDVWSQWVSSVCWPPLPSLSLERGQRLILMPESLFTPLKCRRRVQMYETKCLCKQVRETQLASWAWAF